MQATFPAIFFDGEYETNIGDVVVFPSLDYKSLQSIFSCKIGISQNQFTIYLADLKTSRRIPITGKSNFSAISRERDCFFLIVLRRSRHSQSQSRRQRISKKQPPMSTTATVKLLKRNGNDINNLLFGEDLEKKGKENDDNYFLGGVNGDVLVCEECVKSKQMGREVGFHWCKYDTVTVGFRSPAGPIARPVRG